MAGVAMSLPSLKKYRLFTNSSYPSSHGASALQEGSIPDETQTQSNHWFKALADAPDSLDLPTDHPHPVNPSVGGAEYPFRIDAQLKKSLTRLGVEHDLNMATSILAGWSVVLSRLSNQEDIVIGVCAASEKGSSASALPVRIDLSGEPNTFQLLYRLRDSLNVGGVHGGLSQKTMAHAMRLLQSKGSFSPQAAFYLHDAGMVMTPLDPISVASDIELHLHDTADVTEDVVAGLRYRTPLFDIDTIKRDASYLMAVLRNMAAKSEEILATIDIISLPRKHSCSSHGTTPSQSTRLKNVFSASLWNRRRSLLKS
ncbi:hypothetical protein BGZ72_005820 [Mortierella alpina]|nr:hypothetical protein BGZ72_005820 [Mortierella alpina]